jgi:hypothetical protein
VFQFINTIKRDDLPRQARDRHEEKATEPFPHRVHDAAVALDVARVENLVVIQHSQRPTGHDNLARSVVYRIFLMTLAKTGSGQTLKNRNKKRVAVSAPGLQRRGSDCVTAVHQSAACRAAASHPEGRPASCGCSQSDWTRPASDLP